jgi:hypothetical protein
MRPPLPSTDACCAERSQRNGGVEVDTQGDAFFVAGGNRAGVARTGLAALASLEPEALTAAWSAGRELTPDAAAELAASVS